MASQKSSTPDKAIIDQKRLMVFRDRRGGGGGQSQWEMVKKMVYLLKASLIEIETFTYKRVN